MKGMLAAEPGDRPGDGRMLLLDNGVLLAGVAFGTGEILAKEELTLVTSTR
jgi:hypothetical protein